MPANQTKRPGKGVYGVDNQIYQAAVKQAVKREFHGHTAVKSKYVPKYPASAEREFQRITNGYMRLLNRTLKEHLPKMMKAYKKERHGDSRFDDAKDLEQETRQEIQEIAAELEKKLADYDLEKLVGRTASIARRISLSEWKKAVSKTLGVDLLDDYYNGEAYERALQLWVNDNVLKIKSIPNDTLSSMREIILDGYMNGKTIRDISGEIQKEYDVSKHKAAMLARDQIATLNANLAKMQQEDAGCEEYVWSTSRDSRVRECHRELDGKTFRWNDPPEMWYETKKNGIVFTGRRCHPGEDYACRCVAIPKFNYEGLEIPMK